MQEERQSWWALGRGDVDATIAQVGFNLAQMAIPAFLLLPAGIPLNFSARRLLPGYALGLLIGSLGMAHLAIRLTRREQRANVTAHVYGNNVPAILTYTLSIMLPVYLQSRDANLAWGLGAAAVTWTGLIKLAAAPFAASFRGFIPAPAAMTVFGAAMYSYLSLVLLQRIFDQPLVGLTALAIVLTAVLANVPITRHRVPPFLAAWLIPLAVGIATGYVHPAWQGVSPELPFAQTPEPLRAMRMALPYLSAIAPIAIYHVLQDIAACAGAAAAGDDYDVRSVLAWDGLGTLACGLAGSVVAPVVYAMLPPYKSMGARIAFAVWTPIVFAAVVTSGLAMLVAQLFPWPILAAMVAYVSIGVGTTTLRKVDPKYMSAALLGFVLPAGAVVAAAMNSALPALQLSATDPTVVAALNRSVYWSSVQGLGNGFLFLVLIVASTTVEIIDRRFERASAWCLTGAIFSWLGLMHSATLRFAAAREYAEGWLAAAAIVYSARWWRGKRNSGEAEKRGVGA